MTATSDYNIKLLINLAKNGDEEAFGVIYDKYFTPIYRYIFNGVKNKEVAEDLAQTVFLKAFKMIGEYKYNGNDPAPYFYTIAKNTVIDHWKKKKDYLYEDFSEYAKNIPDASKNASQNIEEKEEMKEVLESINELTSDQKEIITLRFICDLSYSEISKYTGKNEDAIRQLQCRALRSLKNILKSSHENK